MRFRLASTGLCLLNSGPFTALRASKGSGASFQPWQNIQHLYHWDENQHSFSTAGSPAVHTEVSLGCCLAWFPQYLPCLKLLDYLHLMQKNEEKRWCLLLFYQVLPPLLQLTHCSPLLSLLFSSVFLPGQQTAHLKQQLGPGMQQTDCDLKFTWEHRVLIRPECMKQRLNTLVSMYESPDITDLPVFLPPFSRHKHRISAKSLLVTTIPLTGVVENKTRIIFKNSTRVVYTLFLQWEIKLTGKKYTRYNCILINSSWRAQNQAVNRQK